MKITEKIQFKKPEISQLKKNIKAIDRKSKIVMVWCFQIIVTLALASTIALLFFQSVTIQESSMEPTIKIGEKYFMNRAIYKVKAPKRGDLIVFTTGSGDNTALHVRRVIGLPGEMIQIVDGKILINGQVYNEEQDFPVIKNPGLASGVVTLQNGEYFVLGDNRNKSEDSRYGDIGTVNKRYILGKLWFCISPLEEIGFTF